MISLASLSPRMLHACAFEFLEASRIVAAALRHQPYEWCERFPQGSTAIMRAHRFRLHLLHVYLGTSLRLLRSMENATPLLGETLRRLESDADLLWDALADHDVALLSREEAARLSVDRLALSIVTAIDAIEMESLGSGRASVVCKVLPPPVGHPADLLGIARDSDLYRVARAIPIGGQGLSAKSIAARATVSSEDAVRQHVRKLRGLQAHGFSIPIDDVRRDGYRWSSS